MFSIIVYPMTGQVDDHFRFLSFLLVNVLVCTVGQAKGLLIGAYFANKVEAAVFISPLSTLVPLLFMG